MTGYGGMAERLKAAVLKTADREVRGFESLSLRQVFYLQAHELEAGKAHHGLWVDIPLLVRQNTTPESDERLNAPEESVQR